MVTWLHNAIPPSLRTPMFNESEKTFERILTALSLKTPLSAVSKRMVVCPG